MSSKVFPCFVSKKTAGSLFLGRVMESVKIGGGHWLGKGNKSYMNFNPF